MSDAWDLPEGQTQCDEIADAIGHMRARHDDGQGQLYDAMCRLSLPMAELLLAQRDEATAEAERLRAEAESLYFLFGPDTHKALSNRLRELAGVDGG